MGSHALQPIRDGQEFDRHASAGVVVGAVARAGLAWNFRAGREDCS
jgi:hypothetical protein